MSFVIRFRLAAAILALFLVAACKLIDQTTFAPSPSRNPQFVHSQSAAALPAARVDSRTPLVVIDRNTPVSAYTSVLHAAVQAALARDPNVSFDVTIVVPAQGNPDQALAQAQPQATEVMQTVAFAGVPADRVHLRAAADPNLNASQIRVYVG